MEVRRKSNFQMWEAENVSIFKYEQAELYDKWDGVGVVSALRLQMILIC